MYKYFSICMTSLVKFKNTNTILAAIISLRTHYVCDGNNYVYIVLGILIIQVSTHSIDLIETIESFLVTYNYNNSIYSQQVIRTQFTRKTSIHRAIFCIYVYCIL